MDIESLHDLVPVFDNIVKSVYKKLHDVEKQIKEKQIELEVLEQKCEDKRIISLISTELPKDMQHEIIQNIISRSDEYEFVVKLNIQTQTVKNACMSIKNDDSEHTFHFYGCSSIILPALAKQIQEGIEKEKNIPGAVSYVMQRDRLQISCFYDVLFLSARMTSSFLKLLNAIKDFDANLLANYTTDTVTYLYTGTYTITTNDPEDDKNYNVIRFRL